MTAQAAQNSLTPLALQALTAAFLVTLCVWLLVAIVYGLVVAGGGSVLMLVVGIVRLVVGTIRRVSNALRTHLHRNPPLGPPRITADPTSDLGFRLPG